MSDYGSTSVSRPWPPPVGSPAAAAAAASAATGASTNSPFGAYASPAMPSAFASTSSTIGSGGSAFASRVPFATAPSPSAAASPHQPHRIPFNAGAGLRGAPSALGFGFGSGSTFGGNNGAPSTAVTPAPALSPAPLPLLSAAPLPPAYSATSSPARAPVAQAQRCGHKRRKSASSTSSSASSDEGEGSGDERFSRSFNGSKRRIGGVGSSPSNQHQHARHLVPKKMRTGLGFAGGAALLDDLRQSLPLPLPAAPHAPSPTAHAGSAGRADAHAHTHAREAAAEPQDARQAAMQALDAGELLASLDKPALLALLHKLMRDDEAPSASSAAGSASPPLRSKSIFGSNSSSRAASASFGNSPASTATATGRAESIRARVLRLLPDPSLDLALRALAEAAGAARRAIPLSAASASASASTASAAGMRPEYVWSRARAPLAEYARVALRFAPFFRVKDADAPEDTQTHAIAPGGVHASTAFAFLHAVTADVLDLEARLPPVPASLLAFPSADGSSASEQGPASLLASGGSAGARFSACIPRALRHPASPDALCTQLLPALLDAWQAFGAHVSRAANVHGHVFGHDALQGWFERLEALANGSADANANASAAPAGEEKVEIQFIRQAASHLGKTLLAECGWMLGRQHHQPQQQP